MYFFIHGVFSNASITAAEQLIEKVNTVLNRYFTCQLTMQVSRGALGNLFLFIMQCKFKIPLPPPPRVNCDIIKACIMIKAFLAFFYTWKENKIKNFLKC